MNVSWLEPPPPQTTITAEEAINLEGFVNLLVAVAGTEEALPGSSSEFGHNPSAGTTPKEEEENKALGKRGTTSSWCQPVET